MCRSEILEIPTIAGENSRGFWLAGSFKPDREAISVQRPCHLPRVGVFCYRILWR